ncbi:hypothetical protein KC347_g1073 [Hortaea werneckii]|nr:hypothetical protein KC347_g1073 [Hortaea werneckii]
MLRLPTKRANPRPLAPRARSHSVPRQYQKPSDEEGEDVKRGGKRKTKSPYGLPSSKSHIDEPTHPLRTPALATPGRYLIKARPFSSPTANQSSSLTFLNNRLRRFAFYRRSVREDDVALVPADKIPRLPLGGITQRHPQNLWVGLHHGLSEAKYKDIAGQDPASGSRAAKTEPQEQRLEEARPAVEITLISKPPHPKFPGIQGAANIDVRVFGDEDALPVLIELRDASHRIKCVFEQPEILDCGFLPSCSKG